MMCVFGDAGAILCVQRLTEARGRLSSKRSSGRGSEVKPETSKLRNFNFVVNSASKQLNQARTSNPI
jgi:hypothetical protein